MPEAGAARIRAHPATTPSITGVIAIAPPAISRPRPVSRAARVGIGGTASLVGMVVMVAMFGHLPFPHLPAIGRECCPPRAFGRVCGRRCFLRSWHHRPTCRRGTQEEPPCFPETLIAMTRIADMKRDCLIDEPSVGDD